MLKRYVSLLLVTLLLGTALVPATAHAQDARASRHPRDARASGLTVPISGIIRGTSTAVTGTFTIQRFIATGTAPDSALAAVGTVVLSTADRVTVAQVTWPLAVTHDAAPAPGTPPAPGAPPAPGVPAPGANISRGAGAPIIARRGGAPDDVILARFSDAVRPAPRADDIILAQAPVCDVLNLNLGPLSLDLLGLVVDLNQVLLDIWAVGGAGNLLGNLVCAVAGLLDSNGDAGLVATALNNLLGVL